MTKLGNVAKMREALVKIRRELNIYCNGGTLLDRMTENPPDCACLQDSLLEIERIVTTALAAPPRNCDVGTAKEQAERLCKFCKPHAQSECSNCTNCKLLGAEICELEWAQMPYVTARKGGNKT